MPNSSFKQDAAGNAYVADKDGNAIVIFDGTQRTMNAPSGATIALAGTALSAGGGTNYIHQATVTLTNAQIKALPTTAVQLAAALGATRIALIQEAWLFVDATAGAYAGLHAAGVLQIISGGILALNDFANCGWVLEDNSEPGCIQLLPYTAVVSPSVNPVGTADYQSTFVNKTITIRMVNIGGDLTGGHASNTGRAFVSYKVLDISTGLLVAAA